jgi:hypothetical protein
MEREWFPAALGGPRIHVAVRLGFLITTLRVGGRS